MTIINKILAFILSIMDSLLPKLDISPEFLAKLDEVVVFFISSLESVSYFIPLDVFVICISVMVIADNFALMMRLGQWVLKMVRG